MRGTDNTTKALGIFPKGFCTSEQQAPSQQRQVIRDLKWIAGTTGTIAQLALQVVLLLIAEETEQVKVLAGVAVTG